MKAAIVVPTIREESILQFLEKWKSQLSDHRVIIVEDNPTKSFKLPEGTEHYSWKEIDADLGDNKELIARRSDAIRNYGFLKAAEDKPDMILTLDDDCYPWTSSTGAVNVVDAHWQALERPGVEQPYFNTMHELESDLKPRGYPYEHNEIRTVINHGLWRGVPDLDGKTQLDNEGMQVEFSNASQQVPAGYLMPMCGMNLSFRLEALPMMYFWAMGEGMPYHRYADIWMGIVAKWVCDHLRLSVRSGGPVIHHSRASNAKKNKELEASGLEVNEILWRHMDKLSIPTTSHSAPISKVYGDVMQTMIALFLSQTQTRDYGNWMNNRAKLWVQMTS